MKTYDWDPTKHYRNPNVAKDYDRIRFSSLAGRIFNYREQRIIQKCLRNLPRDAVVLDVPCGTGRLAEALLKAGLNVRGADISNEMLKVANQRLNPYGSRFTSEVMDVFALSGYERRYDAILCARVLMHFPFSRQVEFLQSVVTLTNRYILINHSLDSPYQRFRRYVKKLLRHQQPAKYPVNNRQILELLQRAGLKEIGRVRMNRLFSEAVYILSEKNN